MDVSAPDLLPIDVDLIYEKSDQMFVSGGRIWHPLSPSDQGHAQGDDADRE